jgi:hypothetical protein
MYNVFVDFQDGAGFNDLNNLPGVRSLIRYAGFKRSQTLHQDLKSAQDTLSFTATFDPVIATKMLTNETDVLVRVLKDGEPYFTGAHRDPGGLEYGQGDNVIRFEVVDRSYLLERQLDEDVSWQDYRVSWPASKGNSILHQLLYLAGVPDSDIDAPAILTELADYAASAAGPSIKDLLDTLLRQYGYTVKPGADGVFRLVPFADRAAAVSGTLDGSAIQNYRTKPSGDSRPDGYIVQYYVNRTRRMTVYSSGAVNYRFRMDGMYIDHEYFSEPMTHRFDYSAIKADHKILRTVDPSLTCTYVRHSSTTDAIISRHTWTTQVAHTRVGGNSPNGYVGAIPLSWGSDSFTLNFYGFSTLFEVVSYQVTAQVSYIELSGEARKAVDGAKNVETVRADQIFSASRAEAYAEALLDHALYGTRIYEFDSPLDLPLGEYYQFVPQGTLVSQKVRIISKTVSEDNPILSYRAEAVAPTEQVYYGSSTPFLPSAPTSFADLVAGATAANTGLTPGGQITQPIDSANLPEMEPEADGLYFDRTRFGFFRDGVWLSYIGISGSRFEGDIFCSGDSVVAGRISAGEGLNVEGDITIASGGRLLGDGFVLGDTGLSLTKGSINLGNGKFVVSSAGNLSAQEATLTGASISGRVSAGGLNVEGDITIASGGSISGVGYSLGPEGLVITGHSSIQLGENFSVDEFGILSAQQANIAGVINSSGGAVGGWLITTDKLVSALTGARVELNKGKNRVSIFDSVGMEKVAIGYLSGLPNYLGGTLSDSDYGLWVAEGNAVRVVGQLSVEQADLVSRDGDVALFAADVEIVRLGTKSGQIGLHWADGASITSAAYTGTAAQADRLSTARTIFLSGQVTGSASFDGSADVSIATTVADASIAVSPYTIVRRDAFGGIDVEVVRFWRQTADGYEGAGSISSFSHTSIFELGHDGFATGIYLRTAKNGEGVDYARLRLFRGNDLQVDLGRDDGTHWIRGKAEFFDGLHVMGDLDVTGYDSTTRVVNLSVDGCPTKGSGIISSLRSVEKTQFLFSNGFSITASVSGPQPGDGDDGDIWFQV